jgi:hypothetical protein
LASAERKRVPLPAARMTTTKSGSAMIECHHFIARAPSRARTRYCVGSKCSPHPYRAVSSRAHIRIARLPSRVRTRIARASSVARTRKRLSADFLVFDNHTLEDRVRALLGARAIKCTAIVHSRTIYLRIDSGNDVLQGAHRENFMSAGRQSLSERSALQLKTSPQPQVPVPAHRR